MKNQSRSNKKVDWQVRSRELSGCKFGRLLVVGVFQRALDRRMLIECECSCGKIVRKTYRELKTADRPGRTPLSCGCVRPAQNPEVAKKISETKKKKSAEYKQNLLEKYGVDSVQKLDWVKEKTKATLVERFGTEQYWSTEEVRAKTAETNLDRYGHACSLNNPEIREKARRSCVARFGHENPLSAIEIKEKIRKTFADNGYESEGEKEIREWVRTSLGLECHKSHCGGAKPFEVDILIPSKQIAIEYNGCYWHSDTVSGSRQNHLFKTSTLKEKQGVDLIHVFDVDWKNRKEAVKSYIRSRIMPLKKIRASRLRLATVELKDVVHLLDRHLQGPVRVAEKVIALMEADEILMAGVFCKPHRQNMDSRLHLARVITKDDVRVMGGLSRIAKAGAREFGEFVSFVDLSISSGRSYEAAGFKQEKVLAPDYFYFDAAKNKKIAKQSRMKSKVGTPDGTTELEHATSDGLYRVWDCGKIKFSFSLD